jgi:hypothetical protein
MGVTGALLMPRLTSRDLKRPAAPPEDSEDERSEEVP